jgi:hypothetical protein
MASSMAARMDSENELIQATARPRSKTLQALAVRQSTRSKTKEEGVYEPFQDDGGPLDITKGPGRKPAPTTVTAWSPKMSAPAGNVRGDTAGKE